MLAHFSPLNESITASENYYAAVYLLCKAAQDWFLAIPVLFF
jgi:hypothetical protein